MQFICNHYYTLYMCGYTYYQEHIYMYVHVQGGNYYPLLTLYVQIPCGRVETYAHTGMVHVHSDDNLF